MDMKKWEKEKGIDFLKKIGIKLGHYVLDFGCRVGHYSIPSAQIVNEKGLVYALDKDKDSIDKLQEKAREQKVKNIRLIETDGSLKIPLKDNLVNVVLVYDVLHLIDNRRAVYKEMGRVLKQGGLLSVYPKHNKLDSAGWGLKNMTPQSIRKEIEGCGFSFANKYCALLSHDNEINQGCVLNFRKLKQGV